MADDIIVGAAAAAGPQTADWRQNAKARINRRRSIRLGCQELTAKCTRCNGGNTTDLRYFSENFAVSYHPDEPKRDFCCTKTTFSLGPPVALTIAGSDFSSSAGIQVELRMFDAVGVFGDSTRIAITAQNTHGVAPVKVLDPVLVAIRIQACPSDLTVAAIEA